MFLIDNRPLSSNKLHSNCFLRFLSRGVPSLIYHLKGCLGRMQVYCMEARKGLERLSQRWDGRKTPLVMVT